MEKVITEPRIRALRVLTRNGSCTPMELAKGMMRLHPSKETRERVHLTSAEHLAKTGRAMGWRLTKLGWAKAWQHGATTTFTISDIGTGILREHDNGNPAHLP